MPIARSVRLLQKILLAGAVVVDAGANIGIILSSCRVASGQTVSFIRSNLALIISMRLRCATRKLPNVQPLPRTAVGERSGETMLYVSDKLNVDHRAYASEGNARRALHVGMVALDDYFRSPANALICSKLDVQGYEPACLARGKAHCERKPGDQTIARVLALWAEAGRGQPGRELDRNALEGFGRAIIMLNERWVLCPSTRVRFGPR